MGSFRLPDELTRGPVAIRRVLIIGSCLSQALVHQFEQLAVGVDYLLFNNFAQLPEYPPRDISEYDFQIVQVAARSVLPEAAYMRLPFTEPVYKSLMDECVARIEHLLDAAMKWNSSYGLLTFVCNFMIPQQNQFGRMLPWHSLRSFPRFFYGLNTSLSKAAGARKNTYILDCDEIVASLGRRYFQDDVIFHTSHVGGLPGDVPEDNERLHKPNRVDYYYPNKQGEVLRAFADEAVAMFRTIRRIDEVKLVIVDLDDTLWRGVVLEDFRGIGPATEGYPLGIAEALLALKARGILLGIVSKNDEGKVKPIFEKLWGRRLSLDDFAVVKINWRHKVENIEEIIREVNVRSNTVVFIDDNPVERESVKQAFPEIRVLGEELYTIRRILLWAPETQVPFISAESAQRTQMVQAQIERESDRARLSKEEFLASLNVQVDGYLVTKISDVRFDRSLELLNKTNQFNTTGRRWTLEEIRSLLADGGFLYAFDVSDKYTNYGIVAIAVCVRSTIAQFAMSCRVIGLGVETRALEDLCEAFRHGGASHVEGLLTVTDINHLSKDLFKRAGFADVDGRWIRSIRKHA